MVGANGSTLMMLKMYSGNCSLLVLFAASLIYLWIAEKKKERKVVLVYVSVAVLALFFCPLLSNLIVVKMQEEEIYYRLLWALPMGVVIAYAAVKFICALERKWIQAGLLFLLVAYIVVGGHLVYKSPQLSKAENAYQVPDAVVNICDAINIPGREVMAVFPNELIQYVRQYSPTVVMPYGYDILVKRWNLVDELEEEMSKDISNAGTLSDMARRRGCHYIVLNQNHLIDGSLLEHEYTLFLQTDGYDVYVDNHANFSFP